MHVNVFAASAAVLTIALFAEGVLAQERTRVTPDVPAALADGSQPDGDIVVTAQKQGAQSLLKVPVPVSVVDSGLFAEREQHGLQDFASQVPGSMSHRRPAIKPISLSAELTLAVRAARRPWGC